MKSVRQDVIVALVELGNLYPDWRFGQLVANVAAWAGEDAPANIWDVSDDELLRAAREHLAQKHTAVEM